MATLLMVPLSWVTLKLIQQYDAESKLSKCPQKTCPPKTVSTVYKDVVQAPYIKSISTIYSDPSVAEELRLRETMRTEASQLQAELSRIDLIADDCDKLQRLEEWDIKSEMHRTKFAEFYRNIDDYSEKS